MFFVKIGVDFRVFIEIADVSKFAHFVRPNDLLCLSLSAHLLPIHFFSLFSDALYRSPGTKLSVCRDRLPQFKIICRKSLLSTIFRFLFSKLVVSFVQKVVAVSN
jgi:hypothetical protein